MRQPYLRPRRCGDFGFVSRHKPAEHRIPDVSATPDVEASCITSCCGRRVPFSKRRCGVTVCLQLRRRQPVLLCFFLRDCFFLYVLPVVPSSISSSGRVAQFRLNSEVQYRGCSCRCRLRRGSRSSGGERSQLHNALLQICLWTRWIAVLSNYRWRLKSVSQILDELLRCSSCFHQSAFQSASLIKSSTAAMFPRGHDPCPLGTSSR